MPPAPLPPVSTDSPRTTGYFAAHSHPSEYGHLFKVFLLVLAIVTGFRLAIAKLFAKQTRGRNKTTIQSHGVIESKGKLHLRHDRSSQNNGQQQTTKSCETTYMYPWIAPPQPLPGPYDPRLYPLPSLRRHSYDPSFARTPTLEDVTASYTRRVSAASLPKSKTTRKTTTIHGTVTTSSKAWRRNQWVISGE